MSKKYNGYRNWETWNVSLWLHNDYEIYKTLTAQLEKTFSKLDRHYLIKESFEMHFGDKTPDMDSSKEMENVDWYEVAESFSEE